MVYIDIEDKLRNYAQNWPNSKLEIYPNQIVELLDERDDKIKKMEQRIIELKLNFGLG